MNYGWKFMIIYRRQGIIPSPKRKKYNKTKLAF